MEQPGQLLLELCQAAKTDVLLVAPFIKLNALQRVLEVIDDSVPVQCVTRWRLDEIAAGVSDVDIWLLLKNRPNASLWLRTDLHAKYYRGDREVLVGSANLTNAALGWSQHPNLELLIASSILSTFESSLFTGSVAVDDELYFHTKQALELFPGRELVELELTDILEDELTDDELIIVSPHSWIPVLRHPEKLYVAYVGHLDELGSGARVAAMQDLASFGVPSGFDREQFESYVGQQLLQKPLIQKIDKFVEKPQRFGAVSKYIKEISPAHHSEADSIWQTIVRWLLYFLPRRYSLSTPNHSEIFGRKSYKSSLSGE